MKLSAFTAGLLLACSLASAAPLRWAAQNDVLTLDPHSQNHTTTLAVLAHVYEGLVRFDERFEPEPALATRWTALSPTHWRFELRRDVRFHDGTPLTADDVLFSFERIHQPPGNMQVYATGIRELRRIDAYTIELLLDAPHPTLLKSLVNVNIVSRDWARRHHAERSADFKAREENYATRHANGTGPFKLLDWQPDQAVHLAANTAWWGRAGSRSNVTELTYLPIKSAATRVAALLSGDVDIVTDLPPQDLLRAKADTRLRILEGPENRSLYIAFDQGSAELRGTDVKGRNPFQDKRVREAMNLAVDREAIIRQVLRGFGRPAALMVPPGVTGYDAALDVAARPNLDRARQLLAEAGYAKGFEVPLHCPNNRHVNDEAICQALVAMWARIGVRARLIAQPFAQHILTLQRFESPLYLLGVSAATFDAQIGLQAWGHSYTPGADGYFNYSHLSDARLDALVQSIKVEPDTARRNALLREALLRVRDESYFVPLLHPLRPWAMKAGISTVHRANDQFEARFTSIKMKTITALAASLMLASPLAQANPLRWAAHNDVLSLDPHAANHGTTTTLTGYAYEGLVRYTEKFEVEPALATKWTAISPTQIRFELRRGVKFHEGQSFNADDVLYSFARLRHPASKMTIFAAGIKEVRKVDDFTVDLLLDSPQPVLLRNLVFVRMLSKDWLIKNKCEKPQELKDKEETYCSRNANGTGRFKLVSWRPDQQLQFTAFPGWWDQPRGNVSSLTYLPIKQDATRVAALLSGDIDLLTDLPPQDVAKLKADPRLKVIEGPENRTIFFFMDQGSDEIRDSSVKGRNPFKDKRVRQALSLALDREAIKRNLMRGYALPAGLMVAPGTAGWTAELDTPQRPDLARAKALLAEAGYPDGFEVPLRCPNDRYVNDEEICRAAVAMWAKIGVRAKLTAQPMSQFTPALLAFDLPFGLYGWGVNTFDAQYTLQDIAHTRTTGPDGKGNYFRLSDAVVDALVEEMRGETDPAKRLAQMQEALKRTRDEVLFIPVHHQVRPWAMKSNVSIPHAANDAPQIRLATVK